MTTEVDESRELALEAARIADAQKGSNIVILQVGEVLGVTEYFVVVSASNRRLVRTLVDEIEVQCRDAVGRTPSRTEGVREQQWVLLDYGDVVVHLFDADAREYWDLEQLWSDAVPVDLPAAAEGGSPA